MFTRILERERQRQTETERQREMERRAAGRMVLLGLSWTAWHLCDRNYRMQTDEKEFGIESVT